MGLAAVVSYQNITDNLFGSILLILGVAGAAAILVLWSSRLKIVSIDDTRLYVSDGRGETEIDLSQMATVRETMVWNPKHITIEVKAPTAVGRNITFIPYKGHFLNAFDHHPLVDELNALVRKAGTTDATANYRLQRSPRNKRARFD
jgi:hypothetical protein